MTIAQLKGQLTDLDSHLQMLPEELGPILGGPIGDGIVARAARNQRSLEALGARLELVAVFDDEDRRVLIHLGRDDAA